MNRPRAADDFAAIRARMEELRREREAVQAPDSDLPRNLSMRAARYGNGSQREISAATGQVRQLAQYAARSRAGPLVSVQSVPATPRPSVGAPLFRLLPR
jgi:hypothetical protein